MIDCLQPTGGTDGGNAVYSRKIDFVPSAGGLLHEIWQIGRFEHIDVIRTVSDGYRQDGSGSLGRECFNRLDQRGSFMTVCGTYGVESSTTQTLEIMARESVLHFSPLGRFEFCRQRFTEISLPSSTGGV
jgi:hypothetical protein